MIWFAAARRRQQERLFDAADRLAGLNRAPLTEAEVAAEIEAARGKAVRCCAA